MLNNEYKAPFIVVSVSVVQALVTCRQGDKAGFGQGNQFAIKFSCDFCLVFSGIGLLVIFDGLLTHTHTHTHLAS
jgi:hypothetical protein